MVLRVWAGGVVGGDFKGYDWWCQRALEKIFKAMTDNLKSYGWWCQKVLEKDFKSCDR